MKTNWPDLDIVRNVELSPDGCVATAHTDLSLQAGRHHVTTTSILITADLVLSRLLRAGEPLPDIAELQYRNLSNRQLLLVASADRSQVVRSRAPAIRATYRTEHGRTLYLEGSVREETVERRCAASGLSDELLARIHLEHSRADLHTARLEPLGAAWASCGEPVLQRHAVVEFVLEGTRRLIRERFGDLAGDGLVVAGWQAFAFPRWQAFAGGCELAYRLRGGVLSSGTRLVHCDFSFSPDAHVTKLTIARVPGARLSALKPASGGEIDAVFPSGVLHAAAE